MMLSRDPLMNDSQKTPFEDWVLPGTSDLDRASFVAKFGDLYEHSPWMAERLWENGLNASHNSVEGLVRGFREILEQATFEERLGLINAHPDLAGKAAVAGELTTASTTEQASAGLDQCSEEELQRFTNLNTQYKTKFGHPFIMAVRNSNRHEILAGFESRLPNSPSVEFAQAIHQIHRIARFRLTALASRAPYARDLVGYSETPPPVQWPNNARVAVQFVVNYEEGGENCVLHGDAASEAFLSEIVGAAALPGVRHMNMESIYEYGSRAGFWRLHRMFTERDMPVTVFAVAMALQRNPEAVAAMLRSNWEIASHGYRWIDYQYMSEAEEREHMQMAIDIHTEATGHRPVGWYLGRCSPNSHRLAAEEGGFLYNADSYADELPYWQCDGEHVQLMVPYTLDANDMRFATNQGFNSGEQFYQYLKDSFDVLYAEGENAPKMMSIGLHCRLVGRPGRAAALMRFLDYVKSHDKAWVCTRQQIAEHWRQHHPLPNAHAE